MNLSFIDVSLLLHWHCSIYLLYLELEPLPFPELDFLEPEPLPFPELDFLEPEPLPFPELDLLEPPCVFYAI